ncbi:formamidopyrimidine-DNA glycosylase [Mycoplasmopsis californica]|uniref:Fpg/Nei family DNA glycosylase n=1 Tax=Mycoplasmopsis equigenitalium TaxID=114883 RepID=A0ABY5J3W1_9BACT|nr:DNA-formamidopyrimidine glycosylase family protein [Mycoplasmopsis equigenitalium]UUD37211.1 Fpg/Nei family DNA glycosylase [Mycoplasmopsis equigenitalium]VEU69485.1 formamidopyrimidine-DNA glycosylase [Mycoplasmopsis californica]
MPELPEILTIKQAMKNVLVGKTFSSAEIRKATLIKNIEMTDFEKTIKGETILKISSKNTCLLLELTNNKILISTPKQHGSYMYFAEPTTPSKHTLVIFRFTDTSELHFADPSQLGCFHISSCKTYDCKAPVLCKGATAKIVNHEILYSNLYKKNKSIKWALKSNDYIMGIGDVYADEILYKSKVHPFTSCKRVGKEEIRQIVINAQQILEEATQKFGSDTKSVIDKDFKIGLYKKELKVYNREGEKCQICNDKIKLITRHNESSFVCLTCQKEK